MQPGGRLLDATGNDDFLRRTRGAFKFLENVSEAITNRGQSRREQIDRGCCLAQPSDRSGEVLRPSGRALRDPERENGQGIRGFDSCVRKTLNFLFVVRQTESAQGPGAQTAGIADRAAE